MKIVKLGNLNIFIETLYEINLIKSFDENIEIPEFYDFHEDPKVRDYINKKSIRDQGECAASWAFSTIG
jgi:hypothetical protein